MIKQNAYLLPEKLDQLSNLNVDFDSALLLLIDIDIYSSQLSVLILISIIAVILHYLELIKLQKERKVLYLLKQTLFVHFHQKLRNLMTKLK